MLLIVLLAESVWVTLKLRQKEPQSGESRQRGAATRATTTCNARQQALERPLARRRLPPLPSIIRLCCSCVFICLPPPPTPHPPSPVSFCHSHLLFLFRLLLLLFALFLPIADFQPASRLVPGDAYVKCTMEACLPHPAPC